MRGCIVKAKGRRKSWSVVIDLGRDPATGKRKQQWNGGFRTRGNAEAYLNEILPQVQNGTWTAPTKETLGAFLDRWLRDYATPTVRATTLASYNMIAHKHLIPTLGYVPLRQLSPKAIQQYFTRKLESALSSTTVRHHAMLLHKVLQTAVREGMLAQNPADRIEVPRNADAQMRVWDEEQAQMFLAQARRSSLLFRLYLFVATTGVRMGEVLGLAWKHVSLTMGTASIAQTVYWLYGSEKRGEHTRLLIGEPKSKQSRRQVPLLPEVLEEFAALRAEQDENRRLLEDRYRDHDLVFCQANGTPLHPSDVRKDFHSVLADAKLPRIRFHDLRHTAATLWLRRGVHPKVVQELLGHATAAFTLQVYSHVLPGLKEQAVNELGARLLGRSILTQREENHPAEVSGGPSLISD